MIKNNKKSGGSGASEFKTTIPGSLFGDVGRYVFFPNGNITKTIRIISGTSSTLPQYKLDVTFTDNTDAEYSLTPGSVYEINKSIYYILCLYKPTIEVVYEI